MASTYDIKYVRYDRKLALPNMGPANTRGAMQSVCHL